MAKERRDKGSGGITKRPDGRWQATWTYRDENDCKKVKTKYGRTKKEALDNMRDWVAGGGETQKGTRTVAELVNYVIDTILPASNLDADTLKDYRGFRDNHIVPRIGRVPLEKLTVKHLDSVALGIMEDGKSPKTAKNCHVFLKRCIREGKRIGWLNKDLAADMMEIRTKKYRAAIYTLPQLLQLIEAMKGNQAQPAVVLAGLLGLRESETAGMMWSAIDLKKGTITIQRQNRASGMKEETKSESGMRTLPLTAFVADYLKALPKHSPFLMTSMDGKKPIHPSVIYHRTMDAMEAEGLPKIRFHDLRHSANNILKQLGVPSETRRDILGHSDTSVTENTYTQTVDWEMREAMEKLETALRIPS